MSVKARLKFAKIDPYQLMHVFKNHNHSINYVENNHSMKNLSFIIYVV